MKRVGAIAIVSGLAALLLAGVGEIFSIRFEAGDVYPEYSTLRADPLGAKAAFDLLNELGEHAAVTRRRQDLRLLKADAASTLVFAGATSQWFDDFLSRAEFNALDAAVRSGVRVVITLSGRDNALGPAIAREEQFAGDSPAAESPDAVLQREGETGGARETADESRIGADVWQVTFDEVKREWGFAVGFLPAGDWDVENGALADVRGDAPLLDEGVVIHGPWRFARVAPEWKVVASVRDRPVLMERRHGEGSIVLCVDSWFLSNEALAGQRKPGQLLWIAGDRPNLVFDETHHGVEESEGVVGMVSRYRLHGVLPGLGILFLLVLWRGSAALVPGRPAPDPERPETVTVEGVDSEAGVVRLMRRSIPAPEILRQCHLAWAGNPVLRRRYSKAQIDAVRDRVAAEEAKPAGTRSFVNAYCDIARNLSRRSG